MDAALDTLRPYVLPITRNLPYPLPDIGKSLLGPECYAVILDNFDLSNTACLKLAVSKGLGVGIIAASSVVKVPQILKLLKSKSADGLSLASTVLETGAYAISIAYNFRQGFPFNTFGETALIVVQNLVICWLIIKYSGHQKLLPAFSSVVTAVATMLSRDDVVDGEWMRRLQALTLPMSLFSKVPQIHTVYAQGSTGQLSAFAVFNFLAGSLARVFTTLQEVDDPLILYGFVGGAILNGILACQMIYYWNSPGKQISKSQAKKDKQRANLMKSIPEKTSDTPPKTRSKGGAEVDMATALYTKGGEKPLPTPGKGSVRNKKKNKRS